MLYKIIRIGAYSFAAIAGLIGFAGLALFFSTVQDLPRIPDPLSGVIETPPTEIYTSNGELMLILGGRDFVPIHRVSNYFLQAVVAVEDHRFWEHHGIDKLRILKALYITLFEQNEIQGASTLTQQLAKNLFFTFERTFTRKFREMLVALQIEESYEKNDILEAYINQIPFGAGAVGIEQGAKTFFGVSAADLTLAQAALLAALPKSPVRYNPYLHFERAKARQKIVLDRMATVGYIEPRQADAAFREDLRLKPRKASRKPGGYFLDVVLAELENSYGNQIVYHGGLKVTTTLDSRLQHNAESAMENGLSTLEKEIGGSADDNKPQSADGEPLQGALVAVEAHTGAIKALAGGRDYNQSEFNRAVYSRRQPGSGFKPFVYYTAFEKLGLHPGSVLEDKPVTIPVIGAADWRPHNFSQNHRGPMLLKHAFIESVNTISAQLAAKTGVGAIIETAQKCGVTSHLLPVYSIALGSSGVSPLDMASAFATFATGGVHHRPFFIRRVEDAFGRVLDEHIIGGEKTLDPATAYQVVDMMKSVISQGTGAVVRRMGFSLPAAGKTGTTNDYKDAWFTGFTPTLSVSVWVGYDHAKPLRTARRIGITGGRGAAPIWADFMLKATAGEPSRAFPIPLGIRFETVSMEDFEKPQQSQSIALALKQGQNAASIGRENTPMAGAGPLFQGVKSIENR